MYWHGIAWGGSLCVRASVLRSTDYRRTRAARPLRRRDAAGRARRAGLKLHFNPNLMIVNREDTTLRGFFHWMRRQSLIMRLLPSRRAGDHGARRPQRSVSSLRHRSYCCSPQRVVREPLEQRLGLGFGLFLASLYVPIPFLEAACGASCVAAVSRFSRTLGRNRQGFRRLAADAACYAAAVATLLRARQIEWRRHLLSHRRPAKVTRLNDGAYQAADDAELNRSLLVASIVTTASRIGHVQRCAAPRGSHTMSGFPASLSRSGSGHSAGTAAPASIAGLPACAPRCR